jgi:Xaa-Pro aminopeptidase
MAAEGVDAVLVTHLPNVFYLTGFTGTAGALLVEMDGASLFTDGRYTVQAREEVTRGTARIVIHSGALLEAAGERLRRLRTPHVAFEASRLTVQQKSLLSRAAGRQARFVGIHGWVEGLRAVKDAEELARMRAAARLASGVVAEVLPLIKPGLREVELAAEIEYRMRRGGASAPAFETIVASGARAALPHARASTKRLRKNELVVLDLGAILRQYCSDLTRTVYLGRAPRRIREWYRAVWQAKQAAQSAVAPGVTCAQVDEAARQVLRRQHLDRFFIHSTGHGLGIEVHEDPRVAHGQEVRLQAGNVVTIEPGVYVAGVGGIRIEDDVLVTSRGSSVLTTAPAAGAELLEL